MKITAIAFHDFKRLREIALNPSADTYVILLGGDNAQGKTSILDGLCTAIGGARYMPDDPIRHGADHSELRVELDDGALVIRRKITRSGETLELRDAGGDVRRPQERLNALIGASFLDPIAFLALDDGKQRAALLKVIPGADQVVELNRQRKAAFDRRTEVNRDLAKAEGELARCPKPEPIEPVDLQAVYKRIGELKATGLAREQAARRVGTAREAVRRSTAEVERLKLELLRAQETLLAANGELVNAQSALEAAENPGVEHEIEALEAEARQAAEQNARAADAKSALARHTATAQEIERLQGRSNALTEAIGDIDTQKRAILAAAKLPVDGLGFDEERVTFQGVPLSQASDAERLRVALALAMATRPGLREVWIRNGALLDAKSLRMVYEQARAADCRVWVERVSDADPEAIIIHDGRVIREPKKAGSVK